MEEQKTQEAPKEVPKAGSSDVEKNKLMAIIGYIIPIFTLLLTVHKKKPAVAGFV